MVRPLHVLPLYQTLDPLLDDKGAWLEPLVQLFHHLGDQLIVLQLLPALHDSHNASLNLVLSVLINLLSRLVPLWFRLSRPGTCLLDLHTMELGCERLVDREGVAWLNLLRLGTLHQDPLGGLAHRQGLQGSGQLSVRDHSLRLHFLVGHLVPGVEHEEEDHLIGVDTQDVLLSFPTLPTSSSSLLFLCIFLLTKEQGVEVSSASAGLQGENSSAVLCKVEVLEHVKGLCWDSR